MPAIRTILCLAALAAVLVAPVAAQLPARKAEPWFVTVTQRVELEGAIGPRFVTHLTAGYLIDSDGIVVTRLVNLDPTAAEQNISVTTATGRILRATFVGFDAPTGLTILRVAELRAAKPLPVVATPELAEGTEVKIVAPAYKLRSLPPAVERTAMPPEAEVMTGRITFSKPDPSLALWGVRFVVESPTFDPSRDLSILEAPGGQPVGLVKYFSARVGQVIGLAFLRDEVARRVVASNGNVAAGWLGADGVTVGGTTAGVRVETIAPKGPAALAGLAEGDVVVGFDGFEVRNAFQLASAVSAVPAGSKIALEVVRGGETTTIPVELGARPLKPGQPVFTQEAQVRQVQLAQYHVAMLRQQLDRAKSPEERARILEQIMAVEGVDEPRAAAVSQTPKLDAIGIRGQTLTAQLAQRRGVPSGVLVTEVAPESLAARAGLEADDVVFEVDATPVADLDALRAAFGTAASAGSATAVLRIQRDGKPLAVTLSVEPFRK
jgi:S1-C subfamily serine protease